MTRKTATSKVKPATSNRILPAQSPGKDTPQKAPSLSDDAVAAEMTHRIREALAPSVLSIRNLSDAHKRHAEAQKHGGGHYSLHVVSEAFAGLKSLQRQQWINSLLEDMLKDKRIHALEMKLKDPDEVSPV